MMIPPAPVDRETDPAPPNPSQRELSEYESIATRLDEIQSTQSGAHERLSAAVTEMSHGFEAVCLRMDAIFANWQSANNRQLTILESQNRQAQAIAEVVKRITVLEAIIERRTPASTE